MERKLERITKLDRALKQSRIGRSIESLCDELGIARATVYRDLDFLRDVLGAPLVQDEQHRYRYARDEKAPFELPGIWLSAEEIYALALTRQIVEGEQRFDADREDSFLNESLAAAQKRLEKLLGDKAPQVQRLKVLHQHARSVDARVFSVVTNALLGRNKIRFSYHARSTDEQSERTVHPQFLLHYRDNWYLDAYDESRAGFRRFSMDRMREIALLGERAQDFDAPDDAKGYGIFSGNAAQEAIIVFSKKAARWVAEERWHPEQKTQFLPDGRFELRVPYSNGRELLMDILRYGVDAEIKAPVMLREQMRQMLTLLIESYQLT
jgi:predicted DNA-binding transcriptional regulator YafY